MILNIAIAAAMWFVGVFLFSYGCSQILICLFCGIPMTRSLSVLVPANKGGIYKHIAFTIGLWTLISAAVIWAVMYFGNLYAKVGFWIGFCFCAFIGIWKMGMNRDNIMDYFRVFGRYYDQNALAEYIELFGADNTGEDE